MPTLRSEVLGSNPSGYPGIFSSPVLTIVVNQSRVKGCHTRRVVPAILSDTACIRAN